MNILEDFFAAIGDFFYSLFDTIFTNSSINSRKKAEKKLANNKSFKIQKTKSQRIFFLTFLFAIIAVMILTVLLTDMTLTEILVIEGIIAVFALLALFGYLNVKFNYYVVSEEHIVHHRLFGKSKTIKYSDIFYIAYRNKGNYLTAYNKYGTILFHLESTHIGIERLTDILEEKGIRHETSEIVTEEMVNSEEYQQNQRKNARTTKILTVVCAIVILTVIISGILFSRL